MMATTIMISTSVKPALRRFLVIFIFVFFLYGGVNIAAGGLNNYCVLSTGLPAATASAGILAIALPDEVLGNK
jgi:hypothetical protein